MECPYFERDPLLDPADLPHPGWLFDVEVGIMGSHVIESLGQTALSQWQCGAFHTSDEVTVPMAPLNWTVSPRFELGYRLPSGFGEVDVCLSVLCWRTGPACYRRIQSASPDAPADVDKPSSI